ncbi:EKC/KEOPS complex subunit TPRKB-like isoform X1 [Lytechinus pictus]
MVAVNKALHAHATGHAKTRTVNSEIIYSLSPSTNISESFKVFAMGSTDTSVAVVVLNDPDQTNLKSIAAKIEGVCVPLSQLSMHTDEIMIKKKYSISKPELSVGSLEDAVICKMATSDVS